MGGSYTSWEGIMAESEVNFHIFPPVYWVALWHRSREIEQRSVGNPHLFGIFNSSGSYRQTTRTTLCGAQQWKNLRSFSIIRGYSHPFSGYRPDLSTQMVSLGSSAIRILPPDTR